MSIKVGITGGGSAGHVVPALAVVAALKRLGVTDIVYFGRSGSIEEEYAIKAGISFVPVPSAGLRRYRSWRNVVMPFTVLKGIVAAIKALRRERPDVLFSKGSYVSVPVGIGAWINRIPLAVHESDHSLGLANKILAVLARRVFVSTSSFDKLPRYLAKKMVVTGLPIRDDLAYGHPEKLREKLGIEPGKQVLLIFCGSSGSTRINTAIRAQLSELMQRFSVVHVCGKGNVDETLSAVSGYFQVEYLHDEMTDALWLADVVVGRAGATTLAEFSALRIPAVLIPLPTSVSRGDQLVNAEEFARHHNCIVVPDDDQLGAGQSITDACLRLAPKSQDNQKRAVSTTDIHQATNKIAEQVLLLATPAQF